MRDFLAVLLLQVMTSGTYLVRGLIITLLGFTFNWSYKRGGGLDDCHVERVSLYQPPRGKIAFKACQREEVSMPSFLAKLERGGELEQVSKREKREREGSYSRNASKRAPLPCPWIRGCGLSPTWPQGQVAQPFCIKWPPFLDACLLACLSHGFLLCHLPRIKSIMCTRQILLQPMPISHIMGQLYAFMALLAIHTYLARYLWKRPFP